MTKPPAGAALRDMLLRSKATDFKLEPTEALPHVWAAMMEMRMMDAIASIVAVADGATSLYISTGGGVIGGHGHEVVRAANAKFLKAIDDLFVAGAFVKRDAPLDVPKDAISFVVLTYDGLHVARDSQKRLEKRESPIWPLFFLGHDTIAALREATEKK